MSFFLRTVFGLMIACLSFFALNATAQTSSAATDQAMTSAQPTNADNIGKGHHNNNHKKMSHRKIKMVNINTADAVTLAKIRGIGKRRAAVIIAYRTKNGNFASVDDLKNLKNAKGNPLFTAKTIPLLQKRLTVGSSS